MNYRVCAYAICKNEEKFVDRWVESMKEADYIVVCDTGSTDQTVDLFKKHGINPYTISISPWRFDQARNKCLEYVPEDATICVCTDLDEVFQPGWSNQLKKAWDKDTKQARYPFVWEIDAEGNPKISFIEKTHTRYDFKWDYPVHEVLTYTGTEPYKMIEIIDISIYHLPDLTKPRSQYLKLLELSAKEYPTYDRNIHYLGREYWLYGHYQSCINTLTYHLTLKDADWPHERCASMRYIARSYFALGDSQKALQWHYRAIGEAPYTREPYYDMIILAYELKNWPLVFSMTKEALKITHREGYYLEDPKCWDYTLYDYGAFAAYQLGLYDEALYYAQLACALAPEEERLKGNMKFYESRCKQPCLNT